MKPVPMSRGELSNVLLDMAERVQARDSFEGHIVYEMPEPDMDDPTVRDAYAMVHGVYRVGNSQGQGGCRVIGDFDTDDPSQELRDHDTRARIVADLYRLSDTARRGFVTWIIETYPSDTPVPHEANADWHKDTADTIAALKAVFANLEREVGRHHRRLRALDALAEQVDSHAELIGKAMRHIGISQAEGQQT